MIWARPIGVTAAPLVFLGCAVFFIAFNPFGLEGMLAERLFAAYARAGAAPAHPHPLLPWRLAESAWLVLFGGGAVFLLQRGLAWAGLAVAAGVAGAAWGAWLLFRALGLEFDAATAGLSLMLLFG